jgi:acyl-coenzyme A synthetase/AMP-(fatty) acid ligase
MYRTGDLARLESDGSIEYRGRLDDFQVKISGIRMDLGEIDTALAAPPAVQEATTLVVKDADGKVAPISLVVLASGYSVDADDLTDFLRDRVHGQPLPESITVVSELPHLTATSDRDPLPPKSYEP